MRRKVSSTVATTAAIAALILSPYPASALDPSRSADGSEGHPITFLVPSDDAGAPPAESRLSDEHAFIQMTLDRPDLDVTSIAVQDDGSGLSLYTTTAPAVVETIIDSYKLADYVEVKSAVHSAAELSAAMAKLTGETGRLPSGEQVAMIVPALDGSRLEVVLDEASKGTGRSGLRCNTPYISQS